MVEAGEVSEEHERFLAADFDAHSYAHSIIDHAQQQQQQQQQTQSQPASTSTNTLGSALARLNYGVEDLQRQIKHTVSKHHNQLLQQAAGVSKLSSDLSELRRGVSEVEGGVQRLQKKINSPYNDLARAIRVQSRLTKVTHLARQAYRFTLLCRRLESQVSALDSSTPSASTSTSTDNRSRLERERTIREAAVILAELESLLPTSPSNGKGKAAAKNVVDDDEVEDDGLRSVNVINQYLPFVQKTRQAVLQSVTQSMAQALDSLDASLLLHSFSTANSLNVLPSILSSHLQTLLNALTLVIKTSLDIASLSRSLAPSSQQTQSGLPNPLSNFAYNYKSRARHEPSANERPQWTKAFWERMEKTMADLESSFEKVDLVEKCLDRLDGGHKAREAMDREPMQLFWSSVSEAWSGSSKESVKASAFMQSTFAASYPRFLRLVRDFFEKTLSASRSHSTTTVGKNAPVVVLMMTALSPLEQVYLNRCTGRLNETVSSSFSLSSALSNFTARASTPTANEGANVARVILNELDAVRFDEDLCVKVARVAQRTIEGFRQKTDGLVYHDHSATTLLGPLATPAQVANRDIVGALYALFEPIQRSIGQHPPAAQEVMRYGTTALEKSYLSIVNPLIMAIRRDVSATINRMHRDYSTKASSSSSANVYMTDLTEKLSFVRDELLGTYRVSSALSQQWALDLARFTVQTFILHASILRLDNEQTRLKMTADMTSIEFAVSTYLSAHDLGLTSMGDQFKALRSFRPLLFMDDRELVEAHKTLDVPTLVLVHHALSRTRLALPHQVKKMSESEYVRWLNEHSESDRRKLVLDSLGAQKEGGVDDDELVKFVRKLLA